jgi:hypothetical protein
LDREYSRVPSRRPAAALRGLYDPAWQESGIKNIDITNSSFNEFKFKLYWYFWKQFGNEFVSYKEFIGNCDSSISIKKQIRKDIYRKFGK